MSKNEPVVFRICFRFDANLKIEERNSLLDLWWREAIEANGLQFRGGGLDNKWSGYVENALSQDAIVPHRELVKQWLEKIR